jgi:hypothetical protein
MILFVALLFRRFLTPSIRETALRQADRGLAGWMEGHAAMDMSVGGSGSFLRRLVSPVGFTFGEPQLRDGVSRHYSRPRDRSLSGRSSGGVDS